VLRLAQARALYSGDPARAPLVDRLAAALAIVGGDRAAVLWLDEYGPSTAHVYCLADFGSQDPRREFGVDRLRRAWDRGVPGLLDQRDANGGTTMPGFSRSSLTVALGSDGTRAWFLAVDSATPRAKLTPVQADDFMFQAGQVGSVVLSRDYGRSAAESSASEAFSGWAVLRDMEGEDRDSVMSRRIATRFLVARVVRSVVEADFSSSQDSLSSQLQSVEREFQVLPPGDKEREGWQRVLDGLRQGNREEAASAVLELADHVLSQGHLDGSLDLFHAAYLIGVGSAISAAAIDGARFQGLVSRRLGKWDDAFHWYDVARELALAYGDDRRLGFVVDGVGGSLRVQGKFEEAAECHREVVEIARRIADVTLEGYGYHALMSDMRGLGKLDVAIQEGWRAFQCHSSSMHRFRVLNSLAGVLVEAGDYDSAEHAYHLVLAGSKEFMHRLHALDAVAYIKALRGDEDGFREALARVDAFDWRASDVHTVATLLYYRGRGLALLGLVDEAQAWLLEAVEYSKANGASGIGTDASRTMIDLEAGTLVAERTTPGNTGADSEADLSSIRAELVALRRTIAASTA
jgi:tetratricopeptide (TPR) repeat protein